MSALHWSVILPSRAAVLIHGTRSEMRARFPIIIGAASYESLEDAAKAHLRDAKLAAKLPDGYRSMRFP